LNLNSIALNKNDQQSSDKSYNNKNAFALLQVDEIKESVEGYSKRTDEFK